MKLEIMDTITCGSKRIKVEEVEQTGGYLNAMVDFSDILYRARDGRYYLEQTRQNPLPANGKYEFPRDREIIQRMEQRKISTKEISEKQAMLWCVGACLTDNKLRKRFVDLIEGF